MNLIKKIYIEKIKNNPDTKYILLSFGIIVLYLLPLIILGENSYIKDFDNLDSHNALYKVIAKSGKIFAPLSATIPNIMNGLSRVTFPGEFNILTWTFYFFKPFTAIILNEILIHFTAFIGMYLLLSKHLFKNSSRLIIIGTSLAFALVSFSISRGIGIAGQPLLLYAFLNIRNKSTSVYDWLIIALFPFYSFLVFSGAFVIFALTSILLYDFIRTGKINFKFLAGIAVLSLTHILAEYRLIYSMFLDHGFVSHRVEFDPMYSLHPLNTAVKTGFKNFFDGVGERLNGSHQLPFIIISTVIALIICCIKKVRANLLITLTVLSALISVSYAFWRWEGAFSLKDHVEIFNTFAFTRFSCLHPIIWYLIFALSLSIIQKELKHGKKLVATLITGQIVLLMLVSFNNKNLLRDFFHKEHKNLTYKEYYSEDLYEEIRNYIGVNQKDYRTAALGIHPAILQYNGFYTLDAYLNNYSLDYKHKFRKIIEKELNKNGDLKKEFDTRGNYCYLQSAELGFDYGKYKDNFKIKKLELNTQALKALGGKYIFSSVEILNYKENGLKFLKLFSNQTPGYKIYLYLAE